MLADLAGRPLVRHAAERVLASGVDDAIVVVGREGEEVRAALEGLAVRCVENPNAAEGMGASLAVGLRALPAAADAAVVALGDQPTIAPDVIDRLIATWRATGKPIVVPIYAGVRAHPVLFARAVFAELLAVRGDQGGRDVIGRDATRVAHVELDVPVPVDVDLREDLMKLGLETDL
jgi:molybdenum cofactor cytidylyltransferase